MNQDPFANHACAFKTNCCFALKRGNFFKFLAKVLNFLYRFFVPESLPAEQFNFNLTDPRVDVIGTCSSDKFTEYLTICKDHGGLLSQAQVANYLGTSMPTVYSMVKRGRFSVHHFFGLKCLQVDEVLEYARLKKAGLLSKGGRGHKARSLVESLNAK